MRTRFGAKLRMLTANLYTELLIQLVKIHPVFLKENIVAHKQQGNLTRSPQWWKHLKDWKRVWHKKERQAYKHVINKGE